MSLFSHLFREEQSTDEDLAAIREAEELLAWAAMPYYGRFIEGLEAQANKPSVVTADHMAMVQQAVRSNTLREIRDRLLRDVANAQGVLRRIREEKMNA